MEITSGNNSGEINFHITSSWKTPFSPGQMRQNMISHSNGQTKNDIVELIIIFQVFDYNIVIQSFIPP